MNEMIRMCTCVRSEALATYAECTTTDQRRGFGFSVSQTFLLYSTRRRHIIKASWRHSERRETDSNIETSPLYFNTMQGTTKLSLSSLVQEHLTTLVREAACVQRHHKRARHFETGPDDGILRQRLHADDINLALQWRGSEKLYATGTVVPPGPGEDPTNRPINLNAYLRSENQMPPPSELGLTSHWLAVDGVQPQIPQNPSTVSTSTSHAAALVHRVPEEQDLVTKGDEADNGRPVSIRQLLPRLLSEELQLYFSRVTIAVERGGGTAATRQEQDAALTRIASDAGLQELVPFFCRYIASQLFYYTGTGNVEHCRTLVRFTRSLLMNPHLHLELQVCVLLYVYCLLLCLYRGSHVTLALALVRTSLFTFHHYSCIS